MAGMYTSFLNPNVKSKYKIKKNYNDTLTPAVAGFVGDIIKDTAVSTGQVANELLSNPYTGGAAAIATNALFGKDALSRAVGKVNEDAGESMRGEVTPMDIANVASLIPIPAGAAVRGGLLGLKAGTKALPKALKGAKFAPEYNVPIRAGKPSRLVESLIQSPVVEGIGEGFMNAPAAGSIITDDNMSNTQKAGTLAAMFGLTLLPGAVKGVKKGNRIANKLDKAEERVNAGTGTGADYAMVNTKNAGGAESDITLSMDTSLPEPVIAAFTINTNGAQLKNNIRLYESNSEFKKIIDDLWNGKSTASETKTAITKFNKGKSTGNKMAGTHGQIVDSIARYKNSGELTSSKTRVVPTLGVEQPFKIDRMLASLKLDPVPGNVGDTRDLQLWDALVKSGDIKTNVDLSKLDLYGIRRKRLGKNPGKMARFINRPEAREAMLELEDWMKKTYEISSPERLAAVRERLYQGIGHSGSGLSTRIF